MKPLDESGRDNLIASIIMSVSAFVAVLIRFLIRKILKQTLTIADWLCLLSLGLFLVYVGVILQCKL